VSLELNRWVATKTSLTKEQLQFWFEVGKFIAGILTPIVVAVLGILLLRRVEGVKAAVAHQSEFHRKWAEQFFECCQQFMNAIEKELAVLRFLSDSKDPNGDTGTKLQKEISLLLPAILELELRIRRSVVFAPTTGPAVSQAANACITLTGTLFRLRQGNLDEIIEKMNEFNVAARRAHAEMLGIDAARGEDGKA
jgi:hypothetical protein